MTSPIESDRITLMVATPLLLETIPSIDPATGRVLAKYNKTSPLRVPHLLMQARAAQVDWEYSLG